MPREDGLTQWAGIVLVQVGIPVGEYEAYYNKQHYTETSLSIIVFSLASWRARAKKPPVVLAIGILKKYIKILTMRTMQNLIQGPWLGQGINCKR